jgi:hypothetical protein
MQQELKNCPFCGGEAETNERIDEDLWTHNQVPWFEIKCGECEIGLDRPKEIMNETIQWWNTRAATSQPQGDLRRMMRKVVSDAETLYRRGRNFDLCDVQLMAIKQRIDEAEAALSTTPAPTGGRNER